MVFAPANVGTVATAVLVRRIRCTTVTLPSAPFGMASAFRRIPPQASTRVPFVMDATILPALGSTTTEVLLHPEKMRFDALSYAMPVGPSHGARGHEVAFPRMDVDHLDGILAFVVDEDVSLAIGRGAFGAVSSSSTVATMSPVLGSSAVRVPIGRL